MQGQSRAKWRKKSIAGASEQRLRNEMQTLFDALAQQIRDLRTEYHMLVAGLKRVEEQLGR